MREEAVVEKGLGCWRRGDDGGALLATCACVSVYLSLCVCHCICVCVCV